MKKILFALTLLMIVLSGCTAPSSPVQGEEKTVETASSGMPVSGLEDKTEESIVSEDSMQETETGTEMELKSSILVSSQDLVNGTVKINRVVAEEGSWLVIHAQENGAVGAVLGKVFVSSGENSNVVVSIDSGKATETLYAMLHDDKGVIGEYEFPGGDAPHLMEGKALVVPFKAMKASIEAEETEKVIDVELFQWGYSPNPIEVKLGQKTTLRLKSRDVPHGFTVTALGIDEKSISSSEVREITFTPEVEGEFTVVCTTVCGSGHGSMRGTIKATK